MKTIRRIDQCLNTKITEIFQHVAKIKQIEQQIISYLPKTLSHHFSIGSFKNGFLVLVTSDPVWASQLRFHLPELRDNLRSQAGLYQLTSIKIHIAMNETQLKPLKKSKILPLSKRAQQEIITLSKVCNHSPLKDALEKLIGNSLNQPV